MLGRESAHTAGLDGALAHFTDDDFSETSAGGARAAIGGACSPRDEARRIAANNAKAAGVVAGQ